MYILKKVQLINWHAFSNSGIISFGDRYSMIVGENRSGKSTIVDAIKTCLLFNTAQYNTAASDSRSSDKRTDIGYVRYYDLALETVSNTFLDACHRKGEVVSYILTEFAMPGSCLAEKAILGLEQYAGTTCVETGTLDKKWFIIKNHSLEELNLFKENELRQKFPKRLPEILAAFAPSDVVFVDDRITMEKHFSSYMGLTTRVSGDAKKLKTYTDIFDKLNSLKVNAASRNSDNLVRNEILAEEKIDITGLQSDLERSKQAFDELSAQKKNMEELKTIVDAAEMLRDYERQSKYADAAKTLLEAKTTQTKTESAEENMIQAREAANNAADLAEDASRTLSNMESTRRILLSSDEYTAIRPIQEQIDQLKKEIQSAMGAESQFAGYLRTLCDVAHKVNIAYASTKIDDFLSEKYVNGAQVAIEDVERLCSSLEHRANELVNITADLRDQSRAASDKLRACTSEIAGLSQGKIYPDNKDCEEVKRLIASAFRDAGILDEPRYLCELIEIADETWAAAAEQYMSNARFHICVSPENYDLACSIEKEYRSHDRKHRGNVWIADFAKAVKDREGKTLESGTLASVIEAKNEYVRAYIDRFYGHVRLAEDTVHLTDKNHTYIAKDGSVYVPGRHGSNRPVTKFVIGSKAREERLAALEKELPVLRDEFSALSEKLSAASGATYALNTTAYRTASTQITQTYRKIASVERLNSELDDAQKRLKLYEKSSVQQQISQLDVQIDAQANKLSSLNENRRKLDRRAAEAEAAYNSADKENERQKEAAEKLRRSDPELCANAELMIEQVKGELRTNRTERIIKRLDELREEFGNKSRDQNICLRSLQSSYSKAHMRTNFRSGGLADMDEYMSSYTALSTIKVPDLANKMEIAKNNANHIFFTTVLGNLCVNIRSAMRLFRERNKSLALCPIDNNIFQIKDVQAAPGYKEEYAAILALGRGDREQYMLGEDPDEKEQHWEVAQRIFSQLCEEPDPSKSILLDYRTYCRFGIEVLHVDPNTGIADKESAKSFEKWLAIGSGGQVELPMYIILGVALSNACAGSQKSVTEALDKSDSIRLCIIDEALARCDGEFSTMIIRFLTERLGLQLITVAPSDQFERLNYGVQAVIEVKNDPVRGVRYVDQFRYA